LEVNGAFGPFVALAAGAVSFLSPCVLPLVPVYVAQLAGTSSGTPDSRRETFFRAVAFVSGFSAVFIALGASVGLVGYALRDQLDTMARIAGLLLIVLGLHQSGIMRIPLLYRTFSTGAAQGSPRGYAGWAVIGGAVSIGWVPCVGPVLGSILTYAYSSATVGKGALLLSFYSLGLAIPFLLTGLMAGSAGRLIKRVRHLAPAIEIISGIVLIAVGILLFTGQLNLFFNRLRYLDPFGLSETTGL
jgi:cytochrome c-type biogenesis protein